MTELDSLWEAIQNSFRKSKGDTTYKNLIAPAKPLDFANGRLRIQLPSQYDPPGPNAAPATVDL